ncbi:MAG: S49 family peptidase [Nitrospirae bacterium]|nr:S49 family peptidase [Nitrospirota bacterium]
MPNWDHVLKEIQKEKNDPNGNSAVDKIRQKYLMEMHEHVGQRNIICYYSGFLSKPSNIEGLSINDEDKNGFMACIHNLDRSKGLDLFLHTPGGSGAATESLVYYLKEMFGNDIRAFVPQITMSAGTIIACACKEIYMGKHSNLGPVDPQINGIPAYAVIKELEKAYNEIKEDNLKAYVWNPILSRYTPGFIQQCDWAIQRAKEMVVDFLKDNMLSAKSDKDIIANDISKQLIDLSSDKGHDKHIHYQECRNMGLEVRPLEDPKDKKLQELVLTIHHCYMYTLSNTPCFKVIENHIGKRYVKMLFHSALMPVINPINPSN